MEERLHQRVVGQDEAVAAVSPARPPQAAAACKIPTARSGLVLFLGPLASAKPRSAKPWPSDVRQ